MKLISVVAAQLVVLALFGVGMLQAKPVQTQMTMDGVLEVDISKARVSGNILLVVLRYINGGNKDAEIKYPLKDVYFIDKADSLKYHVLRDDKKDWLAAPVARNSIAYEAGSSAQPIKVKARGQAMVWFKFPAPPPTRKNIDLTIPGILPFDNLTIER